MRFFVPEKVALENSTDGSSTAVYTGGNLVLIKLCANFTKSTILNYLERNIIYVSKLVRVTVAKFLFV